MNRPSLCFILFGIIPSTVYGSVFLQENDPFSAQLPIQKPASQDQELVTKDLQALLQRQKEEIESLFKANEEMKEFFESRQTQ